MRRVRLEEDQFLPEPPEFPDSAYADVESTGDAMPIFFEWYKWTGLVANRVACLQSTSGGLRDMPAVELAVLRGLLNRASRLMLASLRLAALHKHAEAILVLNRSVSETGVVVQWLCKAGSGEPFRRYRAKGLAAELRLKKDIEKNIRSRGKVKVIEKRMLEAIDKLCVSAEMTEEEILATKPLPDFASMLRTLGHDDLSYTVMQRLGSHAVHGTWPDLMFHYLDQEDDRVFVPSDNVMASEGTEFMSSAITVLEAVASFAAYVVLDEEFVANIAALVTDVIAELIRIHRLAAGNDYSAA